MIFVYIKDWNIIKKSIDKLQFVVCDQAIETTFHMNDKIIMEEGNIIKYNESKQFIIDKWEVGLAEENKNLKKAIVIEKKNNEALMNDYMKLNTKIALSRAKAKND